MFCRITALIFACMALAWLGFFVNLNQPCSRFGILCFALARLSLLACLLYIPSVQNHMITKMIIWIVALGMLFVAMDDIAALHAHHNDWLDILQTHISVRNYLNIFGDTLFAWSTWSTMTWLILPTFLLDSAMLVLESLYHEDCSSILRNLAHLVASNLTIHVIIYSLEPSIKGIETLIAENEDFPNDEKQIRPQSRFFPIEELTYTARCSELDSR